MADSLKREWKQLTPAIRDPPAIVQQVRLHNGNLSIRSNSFLEAFNHFPQGVGGSLKVVWDLDRLIVVPTRDIRNPQTVFQFVPVRYLKTLGAFATNHHQAWLRHGKFRDRSQCPDCIELFLDECLAASLSVSHLSDLGTLYQGYDSKRGSGLVTFANHVKVGNLENPQR